MFDSKTAVVETLSSISEFFQISLKFDVRFLLDYFIERRSMCIRVIQFLRREFLFWLIARSNIWFEDRVKCLAEASISIFSKSQKINHDNRWRGLRKV